MSFAALARTAASSGLSARTRLWQFMQISVAGIAACAPKFNRRVTVAAIHPEVARVKLVAERNRLLRLITCVCDLRPSEIGEQADRANHARGNRNGADAQDPVGRLRKYLAHRY